MDPRFAFPRWAHVPGVTPGADHAPLDAAKALVPVRFPGPPPADHPAVRYGVALCDAGFFWEAHEVLEAVWLATALNSRDRSALRAVIQVANAGLKLRMGRPRAAIRLLDEASRLLRDAVGGEGAVGFAGSLRAASLASAVEALAVRLRDDPTAPLSSISAHLTPCMKMHAAAGEGWTGPADLHYSSCQDRAGNGDGGGGS